MVMKKGGLAKGWSFQTGGVSTWRVCYQWSYPVYLVFTESALRPIQSVSRDVRLWVCLYVCMFVGHTLETTLPEGLETSGRRAYR